MNNHRSAALRQYAFLTLLMIFSLTFGTLPVLAVTPEESLQKYFPDIKYDRFGPGPIKGVSEVIVGQEILYYLPDEGAILMGDIISKDRKNLTRQRKEELLAQKVKDIPLDQAIRIGKGAHVVIEFTDPNCPYCRKAAKYLVDKADLTRYIFFFPLSQKSESKIRYILCAPDQGKAYEEVMTGKKDDEIFAECKNPQVDQLQKSQREIGERLGIRGTPFFIIDGQTVTGADIPRMETLLSAKKP